MASQTITGPDLQYTQDNRHAYGYSGSFAASNTAQTVLDFLSPSGYIFGRIELFAGTKFASPGEGSQTTAQITFNGVVVNVLKNVSKYPSDGGMGNGKCRLIIPPFTKVVVQIDSNEDSADELCHVVFTGRVRELLPVRN